jgi:hypothetical protein
MDSQLGQAELSAPLYQQALARHLGPKLSQLRENLLCSQFLLLAISGYLDQGPLSQ